MQDQNITKFEASVRRVGCRDLTVIQFTDVTRSVYWYTKGSARQPRSSVSFWSSLALWVSTKVWVINLILAVNYLQSLHVTWNQNINLSNPQQTHILKNTRITL